MFRFASPEYLYLLILIPVIIGFYIGMRIIRKRNIAKFGNLALLKQLMPDVSVGRQQAKFYLTLLAIVLTVFMLARPQFGTKLQKVKQRNVEIMVALDISNSMLAEDIAPNRLEKSKQILSRLIDNLHENRIGLVVFAGEAFIQLPATADFVSAKMFLTSISPNLIARQGTAIGDAVDLCMKSFSGAKDVSRTIILITDGENHEDDAIKSVQAAAEKGIVVHVIGMGSPNGAPIKIKNDYKRDHEGNPIVTRLNEEMCQEIAKTGKGVYVRADNTNAAQKIIVQEIDNMSAAEIENKVYSNFNEQFPWVAWLVLVLLLVEFFMMERKNKFFKKYKLFS